MMQNRRQVKKTVALFLAIVLLFTILPINSTPAPAEEITTKEEATATDSEQVTKTGQVQWGDPIQGGTILHTWCWSFNTIKENMADIAAAGFTAVQTSPVNESISTGSGAPDGMQILGDGAWWYQYQPTSFRIGNYQLGTKEEFASMCATAKEYGIKVLVDIVPNHFAANEDLISEEILSMGHSTDTDLTSGAIRHYEIDAGGSYIRTDENSDADSVNGRINQTRGRLMGADGLRDVNTHNPVVQTMFRDYLKELIDLGASGFRYDTAYAVELPDEHPDIRSDFWNVILDNGSEFQYGETVGSAEAADYAARLQNMHAMTAMEYGASDFGLGIVPSAVNSGDFATDTIQNYGNYSGMTPGEMVVWVESHDSYGNTGHTAALTPQQILYGWAILAGRKDSTPLFFSRPDGNQASLISRWGNNVMGAKGDDAFKSAEVTALNHFKNAMRGTEERLANSSNNGFLMIERGRDDRTGPNGAVLINSTEAIHDLIGFEVNFLSDGTYIDRISGGKFTVSDGRLHGTLPDESVVVLRNDDTPVLSLTVTDGSLDSNNEFSGTLELTLSAVNTDKAIYTINDGEPISYTTGTTVAIGADTQFEDRVKITLVTPSDDGWITRDYVFIKKDDTPIPPSPPSDDKIVIYYSSAHSDTESWVDNVHVYSFNPELFGGWPGTKMERIENTHWHKIELEHPGENTLRVIFNNGSGGSENQTRNLRLSTYDVTGGRLYFYGRDLDSSDPGMDQPGMSWETAHNDSTYGPAPGGHFISFNKQDGTEATSIAVIEYHKAAKPEAPTKEDHIFMGWYTEDTCDNLWNFDERITEQVSLYAGWEATEPDTFTVTFDLQSGRQMAPIPNARHGEKISDLEEPVKAGSSFEGWYKDADFKDAWIFNTDTVTENTLLYAKWSANTYTIEYKDGNNDADMPESATESFQYSTPTFNVPDPNEKSGFTFRGWYTDPGFTAASKLDRAETGTSQSFVLYSKWMPNVYTITLDKQDGIRGTSDVSVTYGHNIMYVVTPPTQAGYTFDGYWSDPNGEGTLYYDKTGTRQFGDNWIKASGATLYAKWIEGEIDTSSNDSNDLLRNIGIIALVCIFAVIFFIRIAVKRKGRST